jgi:hypothetical protein
VQPRRSGQINVIVMAAKAATHDTFPQGRCRGEQ